MCLATFIGELRAIRMPTWSGWIVLALVVLAITWGPARRFFGSPALLWCGAPSFLLYLVHEPIIVSLAHLMPSGVLWLVPVVGITTSILSAEAPQSASG